MVTAPGSRRSSHDGLSPHARVAAVTRRCLLAAPAALLPAPGRATTLSPPEPATPADPVSEWREFRDRFITAEGRVIDTGNQGISHSEGQGYALLFAEAFDDRPCFERLLVWTRQHLRRPDGLHAWRFRPDAAVPVDDPNNAADGDLYIAWALLRAATRWTEPAWRREARMIGSAVLSRLVLEVDGRVVLLPGASGFQHPDRVVVNPSYYAFPAIFALARALPDRAWGRLMGDAVSMLRLMRFGRWGLPADWVEIGRGQSRRDALRPAGQWPARFSFDAVRVPLHLVWAGMVEEPSLHAAVAFWNDPKLRSRPAWVDLGTGQIAPYSAPAGIEAVAQLATAARGWRAAPPALPAISRSEDYHSAALTLLSRLALHENPRNMAPEEIAQARPVGQ